MLLKFLSFGICTIKSTIKLSFLKHETKFVVFLRFSSRSCFIYLRSPQKIRPSSISQRLFAAMTHRALRSFFGRHHHQRFVHREKSFVRVVSDRLWILKALDKDRQIHTLDSEKSSNHFIKASMKFAREMKLQIASKMTPTK
jgi:hypothetical protein